MIVLVGNHTRKNNRVSGGPEHALAELAVPQEGSKMVVVEDPVLMTINDVKFAALPYMDPDYFTDIIAAKCPSLVENDPDISFVLAHQEIHGSELMPGRESTCRAHWPPTYPPLISGHIHGRSWMRNVLYTGTPMQHSHGESSEKYIYFGNLGRRIGDLPIDTWKLIDQNSADAFLPSMALQHGKCVLHEYRMLGIPIRVTIECDINDAPKVLTKIRSNLINYYRIRMKYRNSAELMNSPAYGELRQEKRTRVSTIPETTECQVSKEHERHQHEHFGDWLKKACASNPEVAGLLSAIGNWR